MDIGSIGSMPGISAERRSYERQILWGGKEAPVLYDSDPTIGAAAVDAGNTPTTDLRAGLLLGRKTSDGLLYQWDSTATDGTENVVGVLLNSISMLNGGVAENKDAGAQGVVIYGPVKAAALLAKGTAFGSAASRVLARKQTAGRFIFDDDVVGVLSGRVQREVAKTADYTIVAADNGTLFTNTAAAGAVEFTLPAILPGLSFKFKGVVDQNMTVTSAEGDNVVALNDASADSIAFSTSSQKIGSGAVVYSNAAGTKWLVDLANAGVAAATVAT